MSSATPSSPWPSPPKEERETAVWPTNIAIPVIAAKRHKKLKLFFLRDYSKMKLAGA
jgi:hypothetical protein